MIMSCQGQERGGLGVLHNNDDADMTLQGRSDFVALGPKRKVCPGIRLESFLKYPEEEAIEDQDPMSDERWERVALSVLGAFACQVAALETKYVFSQGLVWPEMEHKVPIQQEYADSASRPSTLYRHVT